jgi:WG containing repeat
MLKLIGLIKQISFWSLIIMLHSHCIQQREKDATTDIPKDKEDTSKEIVEKLDTTSTKLEDTVSTSDVEQGFNAPKEIISAIQKKENNQNTINKVEETPKVEENKKTRNPLSTDEINQLKTTRKYVSVGNYHYGRAVVKNEAGKFGYIDEHGSETTPVHYDFAEDLGGQYGMARVRLKDKVGFVDKSGKEVIPLQFRYVEKFSRGLAHARMIDGEQFFIDRHGNPVCEILDNYHEGIARFKKGNKIGYIDAEGNVIIPALYDYGTHFNQGMADVKKDNKHFYINRKGECVKDCE